MSSLFTKETGINTSIYPINVENGELGLLVKKSKCDKNYKQYLEIKYVQCLKKSYIKNEILENKCDSYIKEYIKCLGECKSDPLSVF